MKWGLANNMIIIHVMLNHVWADLTKPLGSRSVTQAPALNRVILLLQDADLFLSLFSSNVIVDNISRSIVFLALHLCNSGFSFLFILFELPLHASKPCKFYLQSSCSLNWP